jgi:hypothetical protein
MATATASKTEILRISKAPVTLKSSNVCGSANES